MIWILFGLFILLCLFRVPIAFSLAISTLFVLIFQDFNLVTIVEAVFSGMNNSTLMAIPGFVLTGAIMLEGGLSKRLLNFLRAWLGHYSGGMAIVTIVACMIFAAISGSSVAAVAAIGSIMIPGMINAGYDKKYAMGLIATAATLGILIPPSISFILYGSITNTSVGDLFIAGVLPGIFFGFVLIITAIIYAKRNGFGRLTPASWGQRLKASKQAIWVLFLPVLIFYFIYGGVATPTETSVVAAVYALIVSIFIYKELRWSHVYKVLRETVNVTSMIYMIVAAASIFGMFLTINQIPQSLVSWISDLDPPLWLFMLSINFLLLILGALMDGVSIILITVPILLPALQLMGLNLYHFAVILVVNLELGMITPPVGLNLFVTSGIADEPIERVIKAIIPYMLVMVFVLIIVIIWPTLSLSLIPHRQ